MILLSVFVSCTDAPDFSDTPEIDYLGVENNFLKQSSVVDTVLIRLSIMDAQGDLGERFVDDPEPTVYLIDERDNFQAATFKLPKIDKQGSGNGVEADVTLLYRIIRGDICCRYPDGTSGCVPSTAHPVDSIFYNLYVVDHAGHQSNEIRVGPVYLECD